MTQVETKSDHSVNDNRPQLLVDIETAERDFACEIERVTLELMVRGIARQYRPDLDFEELLDSVVAKERWLSDEQRHAYKYVLGREFSRRRHKKLLIRKSRDA